MDKFRELTIAIAVAAICVGTTPVMAKRYQMSIAGTVSYITTLNDDFSVITTPPGRVALGDPFSMAFVLDATAAPTSYFDADPSINIYYSSVSYLTATIGSYHFKKASPGNVFAELQLWNDYPISTTSVDSFNISMYEFKSNSSPLPFDVRPGHIFENFMFHAFDFTGTARQSDLISEITPFSGFGSQSMSYALRNDTFGYTVVALVDGVNATISLVPEPASWMMMISGFGMVGLTARSRRRVQVAAMV